MLRIRTLITLLFLFAGGCSWQANSGSQAIEVDPFKWGTGQQVVNPSSSYGNVDGVPLDARTRR
jgi:hypothetical protein